MRKLKTINTFFKRKDEKNQDTSTTLALDPSYPTIEQTNINPSSLESSSSIRPWLNATQLDACHLEKHHGLCPLIWEFSINQKDEIRQVYLKTWSNQPKLAQYLFSTSENQPYRFQFSWFELFPSWFEYSKEHDAIYYFPCNLLVNHF